MSDFQIVCLNTPCTLQTLVTLLCVLGYITPQCLSTSWKSFFASYSTRQPQKQHTYPPVWYSLEPELDDVLVPRMLSITPLESLISSRYTLPKPEASNTQEEPEDHLKIYDCPTSQDTDYTGEESGHKDVVQCKNILKIRRRKMNKHKYQKLQKRIKFVRQNVLHRRTVKKQVRNTSLQPDYLQ